MPMSAPVDAAGPGGAAPHFALVRGAQMVQTGAHLHGNKSAQNLSQEAKEEAVLAQHFMHKIKSTQIFLLQITLDVQFLHI